MADAVARSAAGSALVALAAGLLLGHAALTTPGFGPTDYLSELGIDPRLSYLAGVIGAAAAVALLGWCFGGTASVLLAVASASFVVSAAVPCTPGCPLPVADGFPWNGPVTWQDTVHAAASAAAFLLVAGVAGMLARSSSDRIVRPVSAVTAVVMGTAMSVQALWATLVRSHGAVTSAAEGVAVLAALTWAVVVPARLWWLSVRCRTVEGHRRRAPCASSTASVSPPTSGRPGTSSSTPGPSKPSSPA